MPSYPLLPYSSYEGTSNGVCDDSFSSDEVVRRRLWSDCGDEDVVRGGIADNDSPF